MACPDSHNLPRHKEDPAHHHQRARDLGGRERLLEDDRREDEGDDRVGGGDLDSDPVIGATGQGVREAEKGSRAEDPSEQRPPETRPGHPEPLSGHEHDSGVDHHPDEAGEQGDRDRSHRD